MQFLLKLFFFQFQILGLGIGQRRKQVQSEHWNGKCLEENARYAVADQVNLNVIACLYLVTINYIYY